MPTNTFPGGVPGGVTAPNPLTTVISQPTGGSAGDGSVVLYYRGSLTDPSMETGTTGWSGSGITRITTGGHTGPGAISWTPGGTGSQSLISPAPTATPGQTWTANLWLRRTVGAADYDVLLRSVDGVGAYTVLSTLPVVFPALTWLEAVVPSGVVPAGAVGVSLRIIRKPATLREVIGDAIIGDVPTPQGPTAPTDTLEVDDVYLAPTSTEEVRLAIPSVVVAAGASLVLSAKVRPTMDGTAAYWYVPGETKGQVVGLPSGQWSTVGGSWTYPAGTTVIPVLRFVHVSGTGRPPVLAGLEIDQYSADVPIANRAILATVQPTSPPRVLVTLDRWPTEWASVEVHRKTPDGAKTEVRPFPLPMSGGAGALVDTEAPFQTLITYQAVGQDGAKSTSNQVLLDVDQPWLTDPITGTGVEVAVDSWEDQEYASDRSVLEISGRREPLVISSVRHSARSDLMLRVDDQSDLMALRAVLSTGQTVLLRTVCPAVETSYLAVGDVTEKRVYPKDGTAWHRYVELTDSHHVLPPDVTLTSIGDTLSDLAAVEPGDLGDIAAHWPGKLLDIATAGLSELV